ncbi:uncharacterized protein LOC111656424 [Seriola lalandi dorsalis]|uniref:uncharacterized protein LOC111656424 n=1 Tax=Seriola lalandi dorsalis TaxID=1841481 RepID=UPI000C6FB7ED|nr:uncharacterized protein LOC111656424 [Seriola lalandi dorsalis]XP_056221659.1 uncharacterized protein LOC130162118 [Seriola aureovittata]
MEAYSWSCVLGLLCMPAEVILHTWTVSQAPLSVSFLRVNSSAEITCTTSLSNPMGLYLHRRFSGDRDVVFLSLTEGRITKHKTDPKFDNRIVVTADEQVMEGSGFTLSLSLLELDDTDMYYCSWIHFSQQTHQKETQSSNGTIIIVKEEGLQEPCKDKILDVTLISLSMTAFAAVLVLFIVALILKCRRFRKTFRPAAEPRRPTSPRHICPQHYPYMITSANPLDFRGIL